MSEVHAINAARSAGSPLVQIQELMEQLHMQRSRFLVPPEHLHSGACINTRVARVDPKRSSAVLECSPESGHPNCYKYGDLAEIAQTAEEAGREYPISSLLAFRYGRNFKSLQNGAAFLPGIVAMITQKIFQGVLQ